MQNPIHILDDSRQPFFSPFWHKLLPVGEILLIILWAFWVARGYLDFDPDRWPQGGDFALTVQSYYVWQYLLECGACVFWNGFANGGNPAFVELHGAFLHPLVIITTLIWGVINGAKVTLILCFVLVGIGQWWLAKVMNLHIIARLWVAASAVVSGHLAARMEMGLVAIILSTAFGTLAIAPILQLGLTGKRHYAILLGFFVALTLLSGQGYIQISLLITLLGSAAIFFIAQKFRIKMVREFVLAGLITILLTGVFWVPFLHFFPNFVKVFDSTFQFSQPFEFQSLNLIVLDLAFFRSEGFEMGPYPGLYMNYVGWVPIIFVLVGLYYLRRLPPSNQAFLLLPPFLIYLMSSRQGLQFLANVIPDFVFQLRYPTLMVGLAIPFILGLAAYGLDQLLKRQWQTLSIPINFQYFGKKMVKLPIFEFMMLVFLGLSLKPVYELSKSWLIMIETPSEYLEVVEDLQTDSAQWIQPTLRTYWYPYLFNKGMKAIYVIRPWSWADRFYPSPHRISLRNEDPNLPSESAYPHQFQIVYTDFNEYASIEIKDKKIPCKATSRGGYIDVMCESDQSGILTVYENNWTGWTAFVDGSRIHLESNQWLQVTAPAGIHTYSFRYLPWDVPLGLLLTSLGICLTVWLWIKSPK